MEEDIVYLKELLALAKMFLNNNSIVTIQDKEIEVLEHLLNELERLQKENERLKEEIMENDLKVIGIEEYTKASMGEIIEHYYTANEDCIPKQVIRDKLEKLEEDNYDGEQYQLEIQGKIELLKELLGE